MMSFRDPARLSDGETPVAMLLDAYAARTRPPASDEGAAWQQMQPELDARRPWAQMRLLAGAFTVAFGLFVLVRSAMLAPGDAPAAALRVTDGDGALGGGGASGSLDGDPRGAGGMEGASGGV